MSLHSKRLSFIYLLEIGIALNKICISLEYVRIEYKLKSNNAHRSRVKAKNKKQKTKQKIR